jgi:organic hydroperoxide reductase OsmC/OhrA
MDFAGDRPLHRLIARRPDRRQRLGCEPHANAMVLDTRLVAFPFSSETIWNTGLAATGCAGGRSLSAGFEGDWAPEHLLLLAAESCYMSTFLSLAYTSGLEVLGYVSNARLEHGSHHGALPAVSLAPCIVVGSPADADVGRELASAAARESVVAKLLGGRLRVTADVRLVGEGSD